jgi:hypothetical protein
MTTMNEKNRTKGKEIPVETKFSASVQIDPGTHVASCTTCIGSLPGVKRLGLGVNHPPSSRAEVKERVGRNLRFTFTGTLLNGDWIVQSV